MTGHAQLRAEIAVAINIGLVNVSVDTLKVAALLADYDARSPKPKAKPVPKHTYTPADEKVAQWIYECILLVSASAKEPSWPAWSNEIRMMREIDKRTSEEICDLFRWANADSFWCSNILSPKKLREKWDQLAAKRGRPGLKPFVRETVEDRNARLQAKFLEEPCNTFEMVR